MLRSTMGDDEFFEALKAFLQQYAWKSVDHRGLPEGLRGGDGRGAALLLHSVGGIERRARVQARIHDSSRYAEKGGFRVQGKISQDLDTFRMPVDLHIETDGNPEDKRIEVMGTSSEFSVDTFGKPKKVTIDPGQQGAADEPGDAGRRGDPARRAVCGSQRIRRSAEGIPARARYAEEQLDGALSGGARFSSCSTTISRRRMSFAKR